MLTPADLERRRKYLTATDLPAILGVSPFKNGADVYYEKISDGMQPIEANDAMEIGNYLEPSILAWADAELGGVVPGGFEVHPGGILSCTTDGKRKSGGEPVEAKSHGIRGIADYGQWGPAGTDEIPEHYLWQAHTQITVTGAPRCYFPALIGGRGFAMFIVERSERCCSGILRVAEEFWNNHVVKRIPPENQLPSLETLKRMRREPGKVVEVADEIVVDWLLARRDRLAAEKHEEDCKAALIRALEDGDAGECSHGIIQYMQQTKRECVVKESTFRVLRPKISKERLSRLLEGGAVNLITNGEAKS